MKKNRRLIQIMVLAYSLSLTAYNCLIYGSFDNSEGNVRSMGFGGAYTAVSDDSGGIYYNAGGLSQITRGDVSGTYGQMYVGLDDNSNISDSKLSVAYPLKEGLGAVGVGIDMFSLAGSYSESTVGIYYGRMINKLFGAGGGLKYLSVGYASDEYTSINPVFSEGMGKSNLGIDMGMMYYGVKRWTFGLSLQDINTPDMGLKYEDKVDAKVLMGGVFRDGTYNIASDIRLSGGNYMISGGVEKWVMSKQLAIRGGIGVGSRKYSRVNLGLGYEGRNFKIDYGIYFPLSGINDTNGSHNFTFGYRFGRRDEIKASGGLKLYEETVKAVKAGGYEEALKQITVAANMDSGDKKYAEMKKRLELISGYIKEAKGDDRQGRAMRIGIDKYVIEEDVKSGVDMLLYAYSVKPDYEALDKLVLAISKEHNIAIEHTAKTWNLAEQKIYQALYEFTQKRYDECIKLCEEALALEPNNVTAYKRLGSTFYILGNMERAKDCWKKVIELAPKDEEAGEIRNLLKKIK